MDQQNHEGFQQQIVVPQVNKEEALKFSQVWASNGIYVPMQDVHLQFATDFCNVVLRSLVEASIQQLQAEQKAKVPLITGE